MLTFTERTMKQEKEEIDPDAIYVITLYLRLGIIGPDLDPADVVKIADNRDISRLVSSGVTDGGARVRAAPLTG